MRKGLSIHRPRPRCRSSIPALCLSGAPTRRRRGSPLRAGRAAPYAPAPGRIFPPRSSQCPGCRLSAPAGCGPESYATWMDWRSGSWSAGRSSASSSMPMIAFIGVRISWLIVARNVVLARLAASALSLASCSSRSSSARSVMSIQPPMMPFEFAQRVAVRNRPLVDMAGAAVQRDIAVLEARLALGGHAREQELVHLASQRRVAHHVGLRDGLCPVPHRQSRQRCRGRRHCTNSMRPSLSRT